MTGIKGNKPTTPPASRRVDAGGPQEYKPVDPQKLRKRIDLWADGHDPAPTMNTRYGISCGTTPTGPTNPLLPGGTVALYAVQPPPGGVVGGPIRPEDPGIVSLYAVQP